MNELPRGWVEITLGEIVSKLGDGLHGTPKYLDNGDYYFINGNNLRDGKIIYNNNTKRVSNVEYKKYKKELSSRTLLVSINGTLGNIAFYNGEKVILGKSACYFNLIKDVDKRFVGYVLSNWNFQYYISKMATGTTIKNMSLKSMREFSFTLPPLAEQKAITAVLSPLDQKIQLLREQNATLETLAQTIFKEWFVDTADDNLKKVLLGDVVKTTSGGTPSRKKMEYYEEGTIPWVKSKELNGTYLIKTEEKITLTALKKSSTKMLPANSILIAMYGATVGEYAILASSATCNQAICALLPNEDYPFTFLFMFTKHNKNELINMAVGSAQQNISQVLIKRLSIPAPMPKIHYYHERIKPVFDKIETNMKQIQTLAKTRDALLPKLMNGTVRVPFQPQT